MLLCLIKPILGNQCTVPGLFRKRAKGVNVFFPGFESTPLARQLHQERTQMEVQS